MHPVHRASDKIHLSKQWRGNDGARFVSSPSLVAAVPGIGGVYRDVDLPELRPFITLIATVAYKNRHGDKAVSVALFFSAPFRKAGINALWFDLPAWNNNNNSIDNFNFAVGCIV